MTFDLDRWQELGEALRANPLRTLLTMAGVFWGTLILVLMLGFSSGLEVATTRTLRDSATNAVFVWGGRTRVPYRGMQPGRWVRFDTADLPVLRTLPDIDVLAPRNQLGGYRDGTPVVRDANAGAFQVMGDMPQVIDVLTLAFDEGRFIDELDVRDHRKVAVIGREVWHRLFPEGERALGQSIAIRGVFFQVIGRFHSAGSGDDGDRAESTIHVPFTTFQRAFNSGDQVQWVAFTAKPHADASEVELQVKAVLADRHDVHPDDLDSLGSFNAEEEFRKVQGLFRGIRGLTWLVGAATVLSGAIGVSNVLMIVVRERTREIGLRRALGAPASSIVLMIAQEAMWMIGVAGGLGLSVGVALVALASLAIGPDHPSMGPPQVELRAALAGALLLAVAGAVASVLPAQRAVAIEPVAALRSE
jgi:putative ABC transport system permease protein